MNSDYYKILGVPVSASQKDIKAAYRRLARKFHPDQNRAAEAGKVMVEINEAYEILGNAQRRAAYDLLYSNQAKQTDKEDDADTNPKFESVITSFRTSENAALSAIAIIQKMSDLDKEKGALLYLSLALAEMYDYELASLHTIQSIFFMETQQSHRTVFAASILRRRLVALKSGRSKLVAGSILLRNQFYPKDFELAFKLYFEAFEANVTEAQARLGYCFLNGIGIKRDEAIGAALLKCVTSEQAPSAKTALLSAIVNGVIERSSNDQIITLYADLFEEYPSVNYAFIVRGCLGIGCPRKPNVVLRNLRQADSASAEDILVLELCTDSRFLTFLNDDRFSQKLLGAFDSGSPPPRKIPSKADKHAQRHRALLAGMISRLCEIEDQAYKRDWYRLTVMLGAKLHDLNYPKLLKETCRVGHLYVDRNRNGLPMPRPLTKKAQDALHQRSYLKDNICLTIEGSRIISISGVSKEHASLYGANIFTQIDLLTALAVAFDGPRYEGASFSLESIVDAAEKFELRNLIGIQQKVFSPRWLANLPIGHSIYWVDAVMPSFGHEMMFSVHNPFHNARNDQAFVAEMPEFYQAIERAHGIHPYTTARNSINLDHVDVVFDEQMLGNGRRQQLYRFENIIMRFDASYKKYDTSGREISRSEYANDPTTEYGKRALIATNMFEEIAYAYPAFARVRLFLASVKLFGLLREQDLVLGQKLQSRVDRLRQKAKKQNTNPVPVIRPFGRTLRLGEIGI